MAESFTITTPSDGLPNSGTEQLAESFYDIADGGTIYIYEGASTEIDSTSFATAFTLDGDEITFGERIYDVADTHDSVDNVELKTSGGTTIAELTGLSLSYPRGGKFVLSNFDIKVG